MSDGRNYYCSMKFKFLKIDLESKNTYTCHAAAPHSVNFDWVTKHPGQLFNHEINVQERQQMLANQRNSSCEQNCWRAEDLGAISPRLYQHGVEKTHTKIITNPESIDLTIGGDCNLTCSYCCKENSTAWRRDIINNGNYEISDERFQATNKDKVLLKISQNELKETDHYRALLNEIKLAAPTLKRLVITGGEPFLDNRLVKIIKDLPYNNDTEIIIYTGLGVVLNRFNNMLNELKSIKNLLVIISAECIGKLHEFNRYGSTWEDFLKKVELIKASGIKFKFQSTISNLTAFGFVDFYQYFKDDNIKVTFAYQPGFMAPYVLDNDSKNLIINNIQLLPEHIKTDIMKSINATPTDKEKNDLKIFLEEFVKRRSDLNLSIFPESFLNWTGVKYVV